LQRPEALVDVTVSLWEKLAVELVSLIGDGGFQSVYLRSGMLAAKRYPWIVLDSSLQQTELQFAGLRSSLESQGLKEAGEASILLLSTFLDILTSLIGELLMTNLLHSAWGDDVFNSK
jgi:hypothetical protein